MQHLEGLRVIDLADEKGELCGRLLADLGAEVIRVEPPGGALSRRLPPLAPDGETSLYFALRNAGKRSAQIDPSTPAGRERLLEWAAEADVWIESFAPGQLAAWGLAPESLLSRRPELVVTSITDFGQIGPYRGYRGTDMIGFAMGGMMHRSGSAEKPPLVAPGALAYDVAGVTAAYATLTALYHSLATGVGQHVDVSVMESVANLSDWSLPGYSKNPSIGKRAGAGIYSLYRCADGHVRMVILVTHHWRALLEWMGNPEELADPAYENFIQRLIHQQKIGPVIERFFATRNKVEIACEAQRRGIAATPLLRPGEVLDNEHTQARGTFVKLEVGGGLAAQLPSGFFTIDGERAGPRRGPPPPPEPGGAGFAPAGEARRSLLAVRPRGQAPRTPDDGQPFRGLRVIDFGIGGVGVEVGRLFAEAGAEVIKIESRKAPDFMRIIVGGTMNPSFASSSRCKLSFGVDLKTERGRELVRELVRRSDVTIENNGTGVMERLGLGAAALHEINPRIVSFSSQLAGSSGPWSGWIGYGPSTHPLSGLHHLWNYPEDEDRPAGSTNIYPDHFVGRLGIFVALAGLIHRERSGTGVHTDAAQFEAAIQLLGDLFGRESLGPGSVRPLGNSSERGAPWGAYPCAGEDEWCAVTVCDDEQWQGLVRALGDPGWARDPALATGAGRRAARAEIDRGLSAWTTERPPRAVMEALQSHGVPAGVLAHGGHHMEDPQLGALGYRRAVEQPGHGTLVFEGTPYRGSAFPPTLATRAPELAEHTRELAGRLLGLDAGQVEELIAAEVLEDPPAD